MIYPELRRGLSGADRSLRVDSARHHRQHLVMTIAALPLLSPLEIGALDVLMERKLVTNSWGASRRVVRYSHNFPQVLGTAPGTTALLATLMLRGPQTPGELRIACERMYRFADLSSVEAYLEEMATRPAGALVVKLPKQPGAREHRWAHLLGGPAGAATDLPANPVDAANSG